MDHRCPLGPPQLLTSTTMITKNLKTYIIRTCGLGGYWAVNDESFIKAARLLHARGVRKGARVRLDIVAHDERYRSFASMTTAPVVRDLTRSDVAAH